MKHSNDTSWNQLPTFRLVEDCVNKLRYRVPQKSIYYFVFYPQTT